LTVKLQLKRHYFETTSTTLTTTRKLCSQRRPRDARYISGSWADAEIWPFEIIQDGGGRHL